MKPIEEYAEWTEFWAAAENLAQAAMENRGLAKQMTKSQTGNDFKQSALNGVMILRNSRGDLRAANERTRHAMTELMSNEDLLPDLAIWVKAHEDTPEAATFIALASVGVLGEKEGIALKETPLKKGSDKLYALLQEQGVQLIEE